MKKVLLLLLLPIMITSLSYAQDEKKEVIDERGRKWVYESDAKHPMPQQNLDRPEQYVTFYECRDGCAPAMTRPESQRILNVFIDGGELRKVSP
jgi:hypothetical protein